MFNRVESWRESIQRRVPEWDGAISEEGSVEAPDVEVSPQSGFGLCAQGLDLEASAHVSVPHRYNSACEHS